MDREILRAPVVPGAGSSSKQAPWRGRGSRAVRAGRGSAGNRSRRQSARDRSQPNRRNTCRYPHRLIVNGRSHDLDIDPRITLLDALRENLRLTGTKKGCDRGQCGACTVLVNGRRSIRACRSRHSTMATKSRRSRARHAGGDCIRCSAPSSARRLSVRLLHAGTDLLGGGAAGRSRGRRRERVTRDVRRRPRPPHPDEIRERMSGNICRCGAYVNIVAAISSVAPKRKA
jgi:xanthine dehydrogenase YagT iron-sulfur-binding subunit